MKYVERESYKHLLAKQLLHKWCKDQDDNHDFCCIGCLNWRSNYGVFTELKFHTTDDVYYFENSKGLNWDLVDHNAKPLNPLAWFDGSIDRGKILFVPDITIFHKGEAKIFLEVVHTSPVSEIKLQRIEEFFKNTWIEVYEIEADEILKHDKSVIPDKLNFKRLL